MMLIGMDKFKFLFIFLNFFLVVSSIFISSFKKMKLMNMNIEKMTSISISRFIFIFLSIFLIFWASSLIFIVYFKMMTSMMTSMSMDKFLSILLSIFLIGFFILMGFIILIIIIGRGIEEGVFSKSNYNNSIVNNFIVNNKYSISVCVLSIFSNIYKKQTNDVIILGSIETNGILNGTTTDILQELQAVLTSENIHIRRIYIPPLLKCLSFKRKINNAIEVWKKINNINNNVTIVEIESLADLL